MLDKEPSFLMILPGSEQKKFGNSLQLYFFISLTVLYLLTVLLNVQGYSDIRTKTMWPILSRALIAVILFSCLCIGVDGKRRREKPSRWKETVKASVTMEDKHIKLPGFVLFTYSSEYDLMCNCVKKVPTNVTFGRHFEDCNWGLYYPFQAPDIHLAVDRYLNDDVVDRHSSHREIFKSHAKNSFYPHGVKMLDEYVITLQTESDSGAFMLIGDHGKPICNDHFSDRTATALCQVFGFRGGRRTTLTVADRERTMHIIRGGWPENFDWFTFKCFRKFKPAYQYNEEENAQMLNVSVVDKCREYKIEETLPCSYNQAAAVECYSDFAPRLQFYDFELSRSVEKFYLTFHVRYVKLGRLFPFHEDNIKQLDLLPKRSDFSGTMCGRKISVDFQSTREMGKGRHHVILGKFLKNCKECVQLLFKGIPLFGNGRGSELVRICKPTSREKWLEQRARREEKEEKKREKYKDSNLVDVVYRNFQD